MPSAGSDNRNGTLLLCAATGLIVALLAYGSEVGFLRRLELQTVDARFLARGPQGTSGQVVIVEVDDESLRELGASRWPWPRSLQARLVRRLQRAGARAIAFDILFPEPDAEPAADGELAEAAADSGRVFHALAAVTVREGPEVGGDVAPELERFALEGAQVEPAHGFAGTAVLREFGAVIGPAPALAATCRGAGFVDITPSVDGLYRRFPPVIVQSNNLYPSLPVALAMDALQVPAADVSVLPGRRVQLGQRRTIPLDGAGNCIIDFRGPPGTFQHFSAADVLHDPPRVPATGLRDKIVLIGVTATGLYDVRPTPYGATFEGVEILANALDGILMGRALREPAPEVAVGVTVALCLLIGLLISRTRAAVYWPGCLLLPVGYNIAALWLFGAHRLMVPMATPTLGMLLATLVAGGHRLFTLEQTLARLQGILGTFLPRELAGGITDQDLAPMLTGELREVTVLFADLRGFTAASARLGPERSVALLNRYFALMHEGIQQFGGTVDKFVGDELMAVWNAPTEQIDHAHLAVAAAVELQKRVELRHDEWEFYGMPELRACAGVATGQAIVGYLGSGERMQYTAVGDTVNLASRLENLAKDLEVPILISEKAHRLVSDMVETTARGCFELRGIDGECPAYEVLGLRETGAASPDGE